MKVNQRFRSLHNPNIYFTVIGIDGISNYVVEGSHNKKCVTVTSDGAYKVPEPLETWVKLFDHEKPLLAISTGRFYKDKDGVFWYVRSSKDNNVVAVSIAAYPQSASWGGESHSLIEEVKAQFTPVTRME